MLREFTTGTDSPAGLMLQNNKSFTGRKRALGLRSKKKASTVFYSGRG